MQIVTRGRSRNFQNGGGGRAIAKFSGVLHLERNRNLAPRPHPSPKSAPVVSSRAVADQVTCREGTQTGDKRIRATPSKLRATDEGGRCPSSSAPWIRHCLITVSDSVLTVILTNNVMTSREGVCVSIRKSANPH